SDNLQDRLEKAWQETDKLINRIREVGDGVSIASGKVLTRNQCSCVELKMFERGREQLALDLDEESEDLESIQVPRPQIPGKKGKQGEYVQESFFAAVRQDHLVFFGSPGLTPTRFLEYVHWILREQTTTVPTTVEFDLVNVPRAEARRLVRDKPITKVRLGSHLAPVSPESATDCSESKSKRKRVVRRLESQQPTIWRKILKLLKEEGVAEAIPDFSDIDESHLTVSVEVGFDRIVLESDQKVLRDLSNLDIQDSDGNKAIQLELKGGTKIKGDILQVRQRISLEAINGNIHRDEAFRGLTEWLKTLASEGELADN
ncbi:MAG: hypothetical protein KDD60_07825, partial [Bdellovibrionales bacterium]|nr:hypothetical protein [Bdellovibrionales bacterium]